MPRIRVAPDDPRRADDAAAFQAARLSGEQWQRDRVSHRH